MRYLIVLLISLSLASCKLNILNTSVCPDKTTVEIGVTETDAKNDKLQEKKSITQTWKWGKKSCKDN
jgi:N12 class adenine-specific DNA methylase